MNLSLSGRRASDHQAAEWRSMSLFERRFGGADAEASGD